MTETLLLPEPWSLAVADLFAQLGTPRFPGALRQVLLLCAEFDSIVVTRLPERRPPVSVFHDLDEVQAAITLDFYASGPYVLDPFVLAVQEGREPGVYRLKELVTESFFRSEYYRKFFRKIRLSDEIGLLIREADDNWLMISIARSLRQPRFTAANVDNLRSAFALIAAAALRQWGDADARGEGADEPEIALRLESFGAETLSPREAEIIRLVLQGHSSPSIASYLDIAEGTVKVHRRHAYAKLGISSQAELLALAAQHLATRDGGA